MISQLNKKTIDDAVAQAAQTDEKPGYAAVLSKSYISPVEYDPGDTTVRQRRYLTKKDTATSPAAVVFIPTEKRETTAEYTFIGSSITTMVDPARETNDDYGAKEKEAMKTAEAVELFQQVNANTVFGSCNRMTYEKKEELIRRMAHPLGKVERDLAYALSGIRSRDVDVSPASLN